MPITESYFEEPLPVHQVILEPTQHILFPKLHIWEVLMHRLEASKTCLFLYRGIFGFVDHIRQFRFAFLQSSTLNFAVGVESFHHVLCSITITPTYKENKTSFDLLTHLSIFFFFVKKKN